MKTVRVIYKLKIIEDVPVDDYSHNADGSFATLEQIRNWEDENLITMMAETEKNHGGQVTGIVVVEELA